MSGRDSQNPTRLRHGQSPQNRESRCVHRPAHGEDRFDMKSAPIISIGDVTIPLGDFAVAGTAWLGIKKAGKTYGAKGVAEQLIEHGVPLIVFDAIGLWRFLKTPGDGNGGKGYKVVVAGGEEPDIPLTAQNASEIIRAAMRSNVSLILDLYDPKLSKADWRKIVQAGFHTLLYENKQHGPRYIILEEAAEYVPQKVYDGETYAAVEKTVRMGGNVGLGVALINPRSQELNKAVLDLCDNLILMRQRGSAAIDAVQKWMDKVNPEIANEITASLPKISGGEGWVWAENSETPVFTKTHKLHSFHPDRTKHGENIKARQSVDTAEFVSTLLSELPKVVEEKKANDPAELKRKVSDLEKKLRVMEQRAPEIKQAEPIKVPVFTPDEITLLKTLDDYLQPQNLGGLLDRVSKLLSGLPSRLKAMPPARNPRVLEMRQVIRSVRAVRPTGDSYGNGSEVSGGLRRMMIALAQRSPLSKRQLGVRSGLSSTSGTFGTYLAKLRTNGWVAGEGESLSITEDGLRALGHFEPLPEGQDLLNYWLSDLGSSGAARMLQVIAEAYPSTLSKEELGERANISHTSGTFGTYLAKLRTLELVEGRGEIVASKEFFE
jgi:hypothetical protein